MDKVAIFVDMGYLNKITSRNGNLKIDFNKMPSNLILAGEQHYRTYIYHCPPYQGNPPTADEKLRKSKYDKYIHNIAKGDRVELRSGRLVKKTPTLFIQKRVDTYFAIDLVKLSINRTIQKAILIAGDSDFVPAIKEAKEQGTVIKTFYCKHSIHDELTKACDEMGEITPELLQKLKYN